MHEGKLKRKNKNYNSSDDSRCKDTIKNNVNYEDVKLAKKIKIEVNDYEAIDSMDFQVQGKSIKEEIVTDGEDTEIRKSKKKKKKSNSDENQIFNVKQVEDQYDELYVKKEKKKKKKKDTERIEDSNLEGTNQQKIKLEVVDTIINNDEGDVEGKKKNNSDENQIFNVKQVEDQYDELNVKKEKKKKKKKDTERYEDSNLEVINQQKIKLEVVDTITNNDEGDVEGKKKKKKKSREIKIEIENLNTEECINESIIEVKEPSKKKKRKHQEESVENDLSQEQFSQEDSGDKEKKKKKKKRNHDIELPEDNELVKKEHEEFILQNMTIKIEPESIEESVDLSKTEKKKKKSKKSSEQEVIENQTNNNVDLTSDNTKSENQEPNEHVEKVKKKKKKLESESTVNSLEESTEKSSKKKKKLSSRFVENVVKELKSSKNDKIKSKKEVESDSDYGIYSSSSSEESLIEEEPRNNTTSKEVEEQDSQKKQHISDSELSDDEDDEDFDEEETQPRKRRHKSIFEQNPKLAKMMTESDDERDELQFQQLNIRESQQLSELVIKLIHHVLPQHHVEKYAGTRPLNKEEKERFKKYAPLKLGVFSPEEDNRIVHNWKKFCKVHNWKRSLVQPFIFKKRRGFYFISKVEERKRFVQFLAHGLPNRSLYSVYGRFKNLYGTHKQSRYTPQEDETILKMINDRTIKHPQVVLAKRLNRTRQSVWRRIQKLTKQSEESD